MTETLPGKFIVLDGPEGSGKSTQLLRLVEWLRDSGRQSTAVRDPGSTVVSERIRHLLLDKTLPDIDVRTEVFLYMASRAEMVARVIRPALSVGLVVVGDRYVSSTVAYQGYGGGFEPSAIWQLAKVACGEVMPDLTIILDLPVSVGFERIHGAKPRAKGGPQLSFQFFCDRVEMRDRPFHERVRRGYLEMAQADPAKFAVVDAQRPPEEVAAAVREAVARVLR